jgi:hypothetical protein
MKNVTISLDETVARWARVKAAEEDKSLSRFLAELLEERMKHEADYQAGLEVFRSKSPSVCEKRARSYRPATSFMTARYFVDSNVVVYARDLTERGKQKRAELWIETLWIAGAGRLSYQVLIEAYAALTRPGLSRMNTSTARTYILNFRRWHPFMADGLPFEIGPESLS